jgi:hypothetical protein
MPNWIPITIETLYEANIAALIDACSSAAKANGQPDRAPGIIEGIVTEVRNSIARLHDVDSDESTIPRALRDLVVDLAIARLKKALGNPLTEDERDAQTHRYQQLRDIEKGDGPAIDKPDAPIEPEISAPVPAPKISKPCREFTRKSQDGI